MPCNCGKKTTPKANFKFTGPNGQTKVYKTEIEARAATIRAGGGSYTAVPVR